MVENTQKTELPIGSGLAAPESRVVVTDPVAYLAAVPDLDLLDEVRRRVVAIRCDPARATHLHNQASVHLDFARDHLVKAGIPHAAAVAEVEAAKRRNAELEAEVAQLKADAAQLKADAAKAQEMATAGVKA
jgi:hypothetical protein